MEHRSFDMIFTYFKYARNRRKRCKSTLDLGSRDLEGSHWKGDSSCEYSKVL